MNSETSYQSTGNNRNPLKPSFTLDKKTGEKLIRTIKPSNHIVSFFEALCMKGFTTVNGQWTEG